MAIQLFMPSYRIEECLAEIRECLEKGWTGLGFKTVQFEQKWMEHTGFRHAHFINSATVGLSLAVEVLMKQHGWKKGDEIISTPLTFVSTNHAVLYNGLKVVFADVDDSLCLDPKEIERKITSKTRAVIFVGIGGNTGQYEEVEKLCRQRGLKLILDAAHMSGTRLHGEQVGREADAAVFSFQAVKNLPTADSGMICFKDGEADELCRKLTWLGINKDTYARTNDKGVYKWKYDVEHVGYKYHGNSIMAAIGLVQLKYLDQDNAYRRQIAEWYDAAFKAQEDLIRPIQPSTGCESSCHLYVIEVDDRDQLLLYLNEQEVYPGVHYRDNTEYRMYAYGKNSCPNSHRLSEKILSLPNHLRLSKADVDAVARYVIEFCRNRHIGGNVEGAMPASEQ